ncbi:L-tyrosine/L-tryptophan isonitrile synthase family protein [Streptomyces endophytica]|uniref:L-tyrosine/L-tryptophan isonitrile synthase family protein n=1 Tax=Streptomyces endophytica TaxID=2991496 RepID=UPI00311B099C
MLTRPDRVLPARPAVLPPPADPGAVCAAVLAVLLPYRRTLDTAGGDGPDAFPEQYRQLMGPVAAGEPIVFTLPGFPCKSPNPAKVLGPLPDEGERLALRFLDALCARIEAVHPPGARVVICSDGHVFSDLIHVPDHAVDAYGDALRALIRAEGLTRLDVFDLRAVYGPGLSYDARRALVDERYAPRWRRCAPGPAATSRPAGCTRASPGSSSRTPPRSPAPVRRCSATAAGARTG